MHEVSSSTKIQIAVFNINTERKGYVSIKLDDLKARLKWAQIIFIEEPFGESVRFLVDKEAFKKLCRLGFKECQSAIEVSEEKNE